MYRFYIQKSQKRDNRIEITGEDVNHITNVLRMKAGEQIVLCDGEGTEYVCRLEDNRKCGRRDRQYGEDGRKDGRGGMAHGKGGSPDNGGHGLFAEILEEREAKTELPVRLVLFQGLPKKDKMELIIQKAVELGVDQIIPVVTKRTVVRTDEGKEEKKLARWQAIAESAAKQSQRGRIPEVSKMISFQEALAKMKEIGYNGILYENACGMRTTKEFIARAAGEKRVGIFVGPEGGFAEEEVQSAVAAGARCLSLGGRILRTETAGFAMLSLLMMEIECAQEA